MAELGNSVLASANAAVRFLLELIAVAVLGYWGSSIGQSQFLKLGLGLGVPVMVIVIWGLFGSPAAPYRLNQPWRLLLEILILGGAALALYLLDHPGHAGLFALVAIVNTGLLYAFSQS